MERESHNLPDNLSTLLFHTPPSHPSTPQIPVPAFILISTLSCTAPNIVGLAAVSVAAGGLPLRGRSNSQRSVEVEKANNKL